MSCGRGCRCKWQRWPKFSSQRGKEQLYIRMRDWYCERAFQLVTGYLSVLPWAHFCAELCAAWTARKEKKMNEQVTLPGQEALHDYDVS